MRIARFLQESLQDGKGCNLVVVLQGCDIHCPGCHNEEIWSPEGGRESSLKEVMSLVTKVTTGITISGGEPTMQLKACFDILVAAKYMGLQTTLYTGTELSEFTKYASNLLPYLDYLKVGPYVAELRDTTQGPFGSTNQRMLEVSKL